MNKIQESQIAEKTKIDNMKSMDSNKQALGKIIGEENVGSVMSSMGITESNINSESSMRKLSAFTEGVGLAQQHGGEAGTKQFLQEFNDGASNGKFNPQSPFDAIKQISGGIATQSILKDTASKFGNNAQEYVLAVAGTDSSKGLDFGKAKSAMNDLSVAQQVLGSDFVPVLNTALRNSENQGISPKAELDSQVQKAMQDVQQEPEIKDSSLPKQD